MIAPKLDSILVLLFQSEGQYVPCAKIAQKLSMTIDSVLDHVVSLQEQGYTIAISSHNEFCLTKPYPYKILPEYIYAKLHYKATLYPYDKSISTNVLAHDITSAEPFVLLTREQEGGKGRAGRVWQTQRDKDIIMTISLPSTMPIDQLFSLVRLACVAVQKTLNSFVPDTVFIKWPNDIITLAGQKICGILAEMSSHNPHQFLIGIGVNINSVDLPEYATSLQNILRQEIDINHVYILLLDTIFSLWNDFPYNQVDLVSYWEHHLAWRGEEVLFIQNDTEYQGIFHSVGDDGTVILIIDGQHRVFATGDLLNGSLRRIIH